jgi:type I restriction enzyme S subunit
MSQPLPSYPDYKPAGLPWLAQVPAHWEVVANRKVFAERKDRGHTGEELLSVTISRGVIRQSDLIKNTSKKDSSNEDKSKYKLVLPGDFAYNKMRMWQGAVGYSDFRGIVSPAYIVLESITAIDVKYYHYLMRTPAYVEESHRYSYGICDDQLSLRFEDFRVIKTLLPPLPEQQRIVAFLEGKTRQIARLLRNKRQLIKLLTEQKQALIHRAVTQGLDADAPRKDSGVAWLGEVPASWTVVSIGRIARVGNGSTPSRATPEYWLGGEYPWLNSSNANRDLIDSADQFVTSKALAECHLPKVPAGSVLVAITGQGKTRGKAALLDIEATINQHIAYITPIQKINPEYLQLILTAAYATLRSISDDSGSTKGALTCADLKRFKIAFPTVKEQGQVLSFLNEETNLIDQTISRAHREIELIQEYRTRLIADVVTGRVDVRHLAVAAVSDDVADLLDEETGEEESEEELLLETEDGRE